MSKSKSRTVKTRILLISDTHAALPEAVNDGAARTPFHAPLPSADVLIHTGDLTMTGSLDEHERALELILSIDAPLKIVIPGNHDLTLDREYYAAHHGLHARYARYDDATLERIQDMYSGPDAQEAGVRYLVEGRESFKLQNGARLNVYASAWQPEFFNWAFGYPRSCDRFNLTHKPSLSPENPVPDFKPGTVASETETETETERGNGNGNGNVDVMLTHGPPMGILDKVTRTRESVGCIHLRRAVERCRPRLHCFGHIHEAWGAVRKRWDVDVDVGSQGTGTRAMITTAGDVDSEMEWTATSGKVEGKPTGQFDPEHNPTTVYDDDDGRRSNSSVPGETLIQPGPYQSQIDRMAAYVDATDLEHGKETVFANASIMNLRYRAVNAPWVIDVELPLVE
ncbi:hypothetical protein RBB50_005163 [Rhinocladiella similis]